MEPLPDAFHQIFLPSIAGKDYLTSEVKEWLASHYVSLWDIYPFLICNIFNS